MFVVKFSVQVATHSLVNELVVVVLARRVEAPVGGVGEHYLLLKTHLLAFPENPLVGSADDSVSADCHMGFDGDFRVEAGFFDTYDIGYIADGL